MKRSSDRFRAHYDYNRHPQAYDELEKIYRRIGRLDLFLYDVNLLILRYNLSNEPAFMARVNDFVAELSKKSTMLPNVNNSEVLDSLKSTKNSASDGAVGKDSLGQSDSPSMVKTVPQSGSNTPRPTCPFHAHSSANKHDIERVDLTESTSGSPLPPLEDAEQTFLAVPSDSVHLSLDLTPIATLELSPQNSVPNASIDSDVKHLMWSVVNRVSIYVDQLGYGARRPVVIYDEY